MSECNPEEGRRWIALGDVPALLPRRPGGRPVSVASVRRWALAGVRGVRLQTAFVGGQRVTTPGAVDAFIDNLTTVRSGPRPSETTAQPGAVR